MSIARLRDLAHYICWKCDDPAKLGSTKLNKVLWLSDLLSYRLRGRAITGAEYTKRQFGPVPRMIMIARSELVSSGKIFERQDQIAGFQGVHFIALEKPDLSDFLQEEIEIVDSVISEICENHTATSISHFSHDLIWRAAKMGEVIPQFAWLASTPGELGEEDYNWADSVIDRIEGRATLS